MRKGLINFNLNDYDLTVLPHSESLEKTVLGMVLTYPELGDDLYKYLSIEGLFYNSRNAALWKEMDRSIKEGATCAYTVVQGRLMASGNKDIAFYAIECQGYIDLPSRVQGFCMVLAEFAVKRILIRASYYLNQEAYKNEVDALTIMSESQGAIDYIHTIINSFKDKDISEGVGTLTEELIKVSKSPDGMLGVKGSVWGVNNILKGYRKGNLIIVGGDTGEGKSTFATQEIRYMADNGAAVGVISLEMTQEEVILKMACDNMNVSVDKVLGGGMTTEMWDMYNNFTSTLKEKPIFINDKAGMRISEVMALGRIWKQRFNIDILFIDHMHLIRGDHNYSSSEQQFTDIANSLKILAKELDIPLVALAQLARKDNITEKRKHRVTDLKYAGGIEQAADVVMFVFRPIVHGLDTDAEGNSLMNYAIIQVEKLRLLPKGEVKCWFDGLRFTQDDGHMINAAYVSPNGMLRNYDEAKDMEDNDDAPF